MWLAAVLLFTQSGAITGDYIEDRANKVYGCYCEWSGEGEHGGREAVVGWRIRSGSYAGTDLAGVKAAAAIVGDRTLSRPGAQRRSTIVVDSRATPAQKRAVEALLRERFGEMLGEVVQVLAEPIEFERQPARAVLRIGTLLNLDMREARLVEDSLQGATLWYDPFIELKEATLGTTLHVSYSGPQFRHKWSKDDPGITGYYGTFELPR
ncbi:MAG: DUF1326 domain-containing protein [Bryobacteraceae bacterium]